MTISNQSRYRKLFKSILTSIVLAGAIENQAIQSPCAMEPEEKKTITLPSHTDLSNPKILVNYLAEDCRDKIHLNKAVQIAKISYEAKTRSVANTSNHGLCFPMNPEILAYAMSQAKDKIILEIAGAGGENAILLAFAGAKQVYMNDIEPAEINLFEKTKSSLPTDISKKLESISGNCFDIPTNKPELSKTIDIIVCRNLIHFFSDKEQTNFFQLIKKFLKPGGMAIFTSNSVYHDPNFEQVCANDPEATRFQIIQGLVTDYSQGTLPCSIFYKEIRPHYEDVDCRGFTDYRLYQRDSSTKNKWKVNLDEFKKLDLELQESIKIAFNKEKSTITKIQSGSVRILVNQSRAYGLENFAQLFKNNDFIIDGVHVLAYNGHVVTADNYFKKDNQPLNKSSQLVGIIVRIPE